MAAMLNADQLRADYIQKRLTGAIDDMQPMAFVNKQTDARTGQVAAKAGFGLMKNLNVWPRPSPCAIFKTTHTYLFINYYSL